MYVKIVSKHEVLVNDIWPEALAKAKLTDEGLYQSAKRIKAKLDRITRGLEPYMNVTRIPMPLPTGIQFRTYTNSLLVNKTAILPSYELNSYSHKAIPDADLYKKYEHEAKNIYAKNGLKTIKIPSDSLIKSGGSLHCITYQFYIPEEIHN